MKREHEQGKPFHDQKGRDVNPKVEWNIVMGSQSQEKTAGGCEPSFEIKNREIGKPLDFYIQEAKRVFSKAWENKKEFFSENETLIDAEVAALRLWTGPMHKEYTNVLRNPTISNCPYVTTLHALNSGITKLARIWRLPASRKVYRGYRNVSLKELKKDAFQCVGGVEKSVLATSEDISIAVQYSGDGAFILEMDVGQVNRGADVRWLSQFPHEKEILFNALSNVEFICSPQLRFVEGRGTVLVYQVCVSANVKSKTLNEFVRLRKDLHLNLVDVLTQEVRRMIRLREEDSGRDLIKRICAECRDQCDCIVDKADKADVGIFNEGAPAYVTLVEDAILLKSRALQIIDLASGWFETGEVDPAKLDGLQDWQLEALRTSFRSDDGPQVKKIVLEQVRVISRLFTAASLDLGTVYKSETVCRAAKLLTLNPNLSNLRMDVPSGTAQVWEQVFKQLCPGRPRLIVNGVFLAKYAAVHTLQQLELRNVDIQMAAMIAPVLQFHTPSALTSLSLRGSSIKCTGAESLGGILDNMQRLRYLDFRSCEIADVGCIGISQGLPALTELEDLNLAHNIVKDYGFNFLAASIRTAGLSRLKSVDMRWNDTQLPSQRCGPQCVMRNHVLLQVSLATSGEVSCVAWSPGGDQVASGSRDTITIWDVKTGKQVLTLKGPTYQKSVAWRPGGDQIACGSNDSTIIIWDAKTGEQVSTLRGHPGRVTCVDWRPGGDQIVSSAGRYQSAGEVFIWDANTGNKIANMKGHTATVTSVAWCPGGDHIASGSQDKTIIVWYAKTGEQVSTLRGHTSDVNTVTWRPGGDHIASGSNDSTIIIWDAKTGEQDFILKGHTSYVNSVAWCPGRDQIVSGSCDHTIIIWYAMTGEQVSKLIGHSDIVTSVSWHPLSDQIVSGGFGTGISGRDLEPQDYPGEIIVWDAKTGDQVSTLKGHTKGVECVAWRPGGDQIASASEDNTIIIWDAETGEQISTLTGHTYAVTNVAWRPGSPGGGDQIASGSGDTTIIIWDAKTGVQISTLKGHTKDVTSVAWRPGGDQIASASHDKTIIIWDAKTGEQILTLKGHTSWVTGVAWRPGSPGRPGGDQIASASWDKTIIIWDAKTGEQISTLKGHTDRVTSVAWRPGSPGHPGGDQIASASHDETIIIWDAKTGEQVSTLKCHTSWVTSVAWRPGSDQIASGSNDGTIIIWNAKTGEQVSMLKGHTDSVTSLAWCPGGDQVASGSRDNTIIFWDAKTGEQVSLQLEVLNEGQVVAWQSNADASNNESISAAIRLSRDDECVDTDAGCQAPPPKKKKSNCRESQA